MLTKGMYGHEFSPASRRFGILCGQMRGGSDGMTHNSGWYNADGEKLGWGDLSLRDMKRISAELEPDEVFIILSEQDSFWNFVKTFGPVGAMCGTDPKEKHPGREYMYEKAMYIILPGAIFHVSDYRSSSDYFTVRGIEEIDRASAKKKF